MKSRIFSFTFVSLVMSTQFALADLSSPAQKIFTDFENEFPMALLQRDLQAENGEWVQQSVILMGSDRLVNDAAWKNFKGKPALNLNSLPTLYVNGEASWGAIMSGMAARFGAIGASVGGAAALAAAATMAAPTLMIAGTVAIVGGGVAMVGLTADLVLGHTVDLHSEKHKTLGKVFSLARYKMGLELNLRTKKSKGS